MAGASNVPAMDTILDRPWTTDSFLAWEDRQDGKHEFDGRDIIPMTGGSFAHQEIVFNLRVLLGQSVAESPFRVSHEMRLRIGSKVRYPDVIVCAGPIPQTTRTLTDAVAIFEVLSDDTATIDREDKLADYAAVPSLRCYVLLEQSSVAATVYQREPDGTWTTPPSPDGTLVLPGVGVTLPLSDLYRGLTIPA